MAVEEGPVRSERKQKETKNYAEGLHAKWEEFEDKMTKRNKKRVLP